MSIPAEHLHYYKVVAAYAALEGAIRATRVVEESEKNIDVSRSEVFGVSDAEAVAYGTEIKARAHIEKVDPRRTLSEWAGAVT